MENPEIRKKVDQLKQMIQDANSILTDLHALNVDVVLGVRNTFGTQDIALKKPVIIEIQKLIEYRDYL